MTRAFDMRPARYAKDMIAVTTPSENGFKTRAARLADSLANGRYSHRETAYIMTQKKADKFLELFVNGWDTCCVTGKLRQPLEKG